MGGNINRFRGRRLAAILGALTLGLTGAAGGVTTASAADNYGNIDASKSGSILIHKHVHQTTTSVTATPDGSATIPSDPVSGVTFTAYKVTTIDLTTAAGWTAAAALNVATACDSLPPTGATSAGSATTSSSGQATISPLAVGAYIVCETGVPSTVVDKAQPFVVTIPYSYKRASGTAESWLYDVNVYPKNGVAGISKTVTTQSALGLGAVASFPVTTDIPAIASGEIFTHYWVQDPMDARLTSVSVSSVTIGGTAVPASYYALVPAGNVLTVQFTSTGLSWLKSSQAGKQLVTTFNGTVASLGTGVITNTAAFSVATKVGSGSVTPDDATTTSTSRQSSTATQNWGDLAVKKVDAGDTATGVAGAVFEVYAAAAPYAATCAIATVGTAISVNSASTFTTDSAGLLTIPGLFVSDTKNAPIAATQRCYVLKEITAPVGYITPTSAPYTAVAVQTGVTNIAVAYDKTITNTRLAGVVLPMTGSDGIVVLSVAGLALIAAGLLLAFLARRRKQTA